MGNKPLILAAGVFAAATGLAGAGEVREFEAAMRDAYGQYRAALFATNAGKAEESAKAVDAFRAAWAPLDDAGAPPQYADDAGFPDTMSAVDQIAAEASEEIAAGNLGEAHETLEAIREQVAGLHARNGVIGFSDRMNAYHARMEEVIAAPATDLGAVREELAVLEYLAADLSAHRPADADDSFDALVGDIEASLAGLRTAVEAGDLAAAQTAIGGMKQPYSKLFLKFG